MGENRPIRERPGSNPEETVPVDPIAYPDSAQHGALVHEP